MYTNSSYFQRVGQAFTIAPESKSWRSLSVPKMPGGEDWERKKIVEPTLTGGLMGDTV